MNLKERSTYRGLVWCVASVVSLYFLLSHDSESATIALSLAATISGGLGLGDDKVG